MKSQVKLIIVGVFVLGAFVMLLSSGACSNSGADSASAMMATPTPPTSNAVGNSAANVPKPAVNDKTIAKEFTLGKDSVSEYGEVLFHHENHAFKNYSPDGKSVVTCVECHHTDQPKSALKPPLSTSERAVALTMETWKASAQKVNECRTCHFQDGNVPEGKSIPSASYTDGAKTVTKDLNNELAYHINCNTCHDAAVKIRPELKTKAGFATTKDCTICHKTN